MTSSNTKTNHRSFALRISFGPYVSLAVIFSLLTIGSAYYSLTSHDWAGLYVLLGWVFVGLNVWFGTRYRIWWKDEKIIMRAAGFPWALVTITQRAEDIERVEQETSNAQTFARMNRPFRRITIYGKTSLEGRNFIDVSLKHFNVEDVRKLMKIIHERRPDVPMPKTWI